MGDQYEGETALLEAVWDATRTESGRAILAIANSGPVIGRDDIDRLFQPFQRLQGDRANHPDGHGLGLSIVQSIAAAHDAGLTVRVRPDGGLDVEVRFPPPPPWAARAADLNVAAG